MELVEIYNYYWNERSGEYPKKIPLSITISLTFLSFSFLFFFFFF